MNKKKIIALSISLSLAMGVGVVVTSTNKEDLSFFSRGYAGDSYSCALPDGYHEIADLCALNNGTSNPYNIRGTVTRSNSSVTYIQRVNQTTQNLDSIAIYNAGRSYTPGNVLDISGGTLNKTNGVPSLNATGATISVSYNENPTGYEPIVYDSLGDYLTSAFSDDPYPYSHFVEVKNTKVKYEIGSDEETFILEDINNNNYSVTGEILSSAIRNTLNGYYTSESVLDIKGVLYRKDSEDVLRIVDTSDISIQSSPLRNVQDTTILQAWNWSVSNIISELDNIRDAGFKTIQVSPLQPQKDKQNDQAWPNQWWKLYQPYGFEISQNSDESVIGTKSQLTTLCSEAKKRGINIIVDVVCNHLAGGNGTTLNGNVNNYETAIYSNNYIHNYGPLNEKGGDTKSIVMGYLGDYPDLDTYQSDVQNRVIHLLQEYMSCGVVGFRLDAAKHIETPNDDNDYKSDFWPNVKNGIDSWASSNLGYTPYMYGEILGAGTNRDSAWYTPYMSVSDAETGKYLEGVRFNDLSRITGSIGYNIASNKTVMWPESHDNYKGSYESSSVVNQSVVNKAYAIQASMESVSTLFLARPSDGSTKMGAIGSTAYKNDSVVSASNKFHNELVDASEYKKQDNGYWMNIRKGDSKYGAMIVNVSGSSSGTINLNTYNDAFMIPDGTYVDLTNGSNVTISGGYVNANFGSDDVMALYRVDKEGSGISEGYGLLLNGTRPVLAVHTDDYDGYKQYKIVRQSFKKDETFALHNFSDNDSWVIDVDGWSFGGTSGSDTKWQDYITKGASTYTVKQDFSADIYIKLKYQEDQIYFDLSGLSLSEYESQLAPGDTDVITVSNYAGSYTAVSSNTEVATVSKNGDDITITAVADGSATITVSDGVVTREVAVTVETVSTESTYYITGLGNVWTVGVEEWKLSYVAEGHYRITNVEIQAGDKLKVVNQATNDWYGNASTWDPSLFTREDNGNVVITAGGFYTIDFYVNGDNNNHIVPTKTGNLMSIDNSVAELAPEETEVITVSDANGSVHAVSNNTGVATVTINNNIVTITAVADGNATITITDDGTGSKTVSVTVATPTPGLLTIALQTKYNVGMDYRAYLVGNFSNWKINANAIAFEWDSNYNGWKAVVEVEPNTSWTCKVVKGAYNNPSEEPLAWYGDNVELTFTENRTVTFG